MPRRETYLRWLRRRVSQTNSRCRGLAIKGTLDWQELSERPMVCSWCGEPIVEPRRLSLDHVLPLAKGGTNVNNNVVLSHRACNLLRGDMDASLWIKLVNTLMEIGLWKEFRMRYKPRRFRR